MRQRVDFIPAWKQTSNLRRSYFTSCTLLFIYALKHENKHVSPCHSLDAPLVTANKYILLTKREVKMAGYWPSSLFAFLWTETKSRVIKTQKNLFTLAENNFSERKLSCTCLNFGEMLFAGTKWAVPGAQYRSILPARVANQNTEFAAYCPLAELAI